MGKFYGAFGVCQLLFAFGVFATPKTVEIISTGGNLNALKEEEIMDVFTKNKTDALNNFTLPIIGDITNYTSSFGRGSSVIDFSRSTTTNQYYDQFPDQIDREARTLLNLVPPYNPGSGAVSEACQRDSKIFQKELNKFTLWALKMYDATAKMPSGLLNGNVNQFGDFDECIGIDGSEGITGQYCLAFLQLDVDETRTDLQHLHRLLHSHYAFKSNLTDPGHRVPRFGTMNWAVCTPSSCSSRDVEVSLRHAIARNTAQTGLKITVKVDEEMCQVRRPDSYPVETIVASCFFLGIIALSIVAAIYDHYKIPASELLLSFSLKRNYNKLMSSERSETDIKSLHAVRAFNAFLLIIAHKSMALFFNPYVNRTEMSEYLGRPWTVIGRAASLYTDPFIMLSGLLTSYSFVGRLNRAGKLDVKNEYLSRLLRLLPTLGALIIFCTYVMPHIGSGPQWNLVVTHHADICKKTGWRNFLFIHNYFGFENMCLTHTHHLGIDTQLFALSPLLVLFLWKRPKIGCLTLVVLATLSTILRYSVTYHRNLNNYVYFGASIQQLFDTANKSYILPTHRLTVYIIGILMGYLLRNIRRDFKMNSFVLTTGWIVSTLMFLAAFVGPAAMGSIDYIYNPLHAATYNAFAPIGWCALFAWIAFVSHTGNDNESLKHILEWKGFLVCTRLSYAIYLTQFPVFFYNVGQTRSSEYYGFFRMMVNITELMWIVLTSAILTVLFDTPFQNIKNHLLRKSKTTPAESSSKSKNE